LLAEATTSLHTLRPGDEVKARELAVRAARSAPDDATRGTALAIAALALVLDPAVEGYGERLTDAFGLAAYAGTIDATDAVGQTARAIVGAAGGAVRQARTLIDLVGQTAKLPDETRALLALARDGVRDRSDAFFDDAAAGLRARPDSARLKAVLAERWLELGLVDEVLGLVQDSRHPALGIVAGRAQVVGGRRDMAIATLRPLVDALAGVDEARRAEALAWLGLAQAEDPALADAARSTAGALSPRPGWAKEAALIEAIVSARTGAPERARQALLPLARGTPSSTLVVERWITEALLDVCGTLGDLGCVERSARRLQLLDVDAAPPLRARARALAAQRTATPRAIAVPSPSPTGTAGSGADRPAGLPERGPDAGADAGAAAVDAGIAANGVVPVADADKVDALVAQAERLSPGNPEQQQRLRTVRRALAARCPRQAQKTLSTLLQDPELRVARALAAAFEAQPLGRAKQAAAALTGRGPPLADDDLVAVIDALGGARLKDSEALFAPLAVDPRAQIRAAVARARADLADPEARRRRLAGATSDPRDPHDDHGDRDDHAAHGDVAAPGVATRADSPARNSPASISSAGISSAGNSSAGNSPAGNSPAGNSPAGNSSAERAR
jgi:hypothetical protein